MRVLITGMGGQLGTQVARLLETRNDIEAISGFDIDPPRRRLSRATFVRLDPRDPDRVAAAVVAADPTVVIHCGIYEPHARIGPDAARIETAFGTANLVAALASCDHLESIVVRSGIEIYGRRRGGPMRPDEATVPLPTSGFGASLLDVEQQLAFVGAAMSVPVTSLRFAPLAGSHFPSPLGRYLKLKVIPVAAIADPTFALLHADDAADAIVAAIDCRPDGPVNVVAPGAVTVRQAVRLGRRVAMPIFGPVGWFTARLGTELASAPLPDHIQELLVRGRVADGGRAAEVLGMTPRRSTREVVTELYEQSNVIYLPAAISGRAA